MLAGVKAVLFNTGDVMLAKTYRSRSSLRCETETEERFYGSFSSISLFFKILESLHIL